METNFSMGKRTKIGKNGPCFTSNICMKKQWKETNNYFN